MIEKRYEEVAYERSKLRFLEAMARQSKCIKPYTKPKIKIIDPDEK